ncbi:hypothetical protein HRbin30_00718 [bacterium HR30]|nr:hypothetical protein HRbin30_00718 [bacterium HR30]
MKGRTPVRCRKRPPWWGLLLVTSLAAWCCWTPRSASGNDCMVLLPMFQRGLSDAEIAEQTQLPFAVVESCRRELSRPLPAGPAGVPPMGAVGPPPAGAASRPPSGAVGPPPMGAPGPPPVGRDIQRLPNR